MAGTYQNADATLADIMGGGSVAAQNYFNQDAANAEALAKEQVQQATIPAEIQKPYLGNLFTAAQTAGQQGIAQQEQAKGAVANALVPTEIGAGQAQGQAKITQAHVGQLQQLGEVVGQLDQTLGNSQGPQRAAMVGQFLDSNGVQDPGIRQLMLNASQQPGGLQQISQGLFNASNQARQTVLGENIRGGYQLGTAQIQGSSRLAAAEANAQARVNVANINAQIKQQMQTFEQAATAAQKRGDTATYQQMSQLAMQMRQAQAQLNSQLLFGQGLPNPAVGGEGTPAPTATPNQSTQGGGGQPPVEDAVTAEMRKRGLLK